MVVMDATSCMVDIARFFLDFTQKESCGKCTLCRVGTKRMLEILERISTGQRRNRRPPAAGGAGGQDQGDVPCGLGQTAPNPVLTTLKYFRNEYEAHVAHGTCPAKVCKPLLTFSIDPSDLHGLHPVREGLPGEVHHRREEAGPRHRPGEMHQVQLLPGGLQGQRRGGEVTTNRPQSTKGDGRGREDYCGWQAALAPLVFMRMSTRMGQMEPTTAIPMSMAPPRAPTASPTLPARSFSLGATMT